MVKTRGDRMPTYNKPPVFLWLLEKSGNAAEPSSWVRFANLSDKKLVSYPDPTDVSKCKMLRVHYAIMLTSVGSGYETNKN